MWPPDAQLHCQPPPWSYAVIAVEEIQARHDLVLGCRVVSCEALLSLSWRTRYFVEHIVEAYFPLLLHIIVVWVLKYHGSQMRQNGGMGRKVTVVLFQSLLLCPSVAGTRSKQVCPAMVQLLVCSWATVVISTSNRRFLWCFSGRFSPTSTCFSCNDQ